MGNVIGVISLKGGVGKTSSVVCLGFALAKFGKKVLLVDGNFSSPNLGLHLNLLDTDRTLHHVLSRTAHPHDAVYNAGGVDLMPCSLFPKVEINPLKLKDKLKYLKRKYDVILIDSSPALNEETLAVMNASDNLVVVTTPDYPTLGSTLKAIKLARRKGAPIIGLIVNKVYNKRFEIPIKDVEEVAGVPIMAIIPYDINILKSLSKFTSIVEYKPNSGASEEYKKLAAVLIGEKYKPIKLKRFFRWVSPQKQDINREIFYESIFKSS